MELALRAAVREQHYLTVDPGQPALPTIQRFGTGALVWGPLGQGLLTGRVRKNQDIDLRRAGLFRQLEDERRLDVVERLIPLAADAGLPTTHLATAFTIAHPGVASALTGVRTMDHLDGLDATLTDDVLDRTDEIVPPGTDVGSTRPTSRPPWRTPGRAAGAGSRRLAEAEWPTRPGFLTFADREHERVTAVAILTAGEEIEVCLG
jgi:hypothetical protein